MALSEKIAGFYTKLEDKYYPSPKYNEWLDWKNKALKDLQDNCTPLEQAVKSIEILSRQVVLMQSTRGQDNTDESKDNEDSKPPATTKKGNWNHPSLTRQKGNPKSRPS